MIGGVRVSVIMVNWIYMGWVGWCVGVFLEWTLIFYFIEHYKSLA